MIALSTEKWSDLTEMRKLCILILLTALLWEPSCGQDLEGVNLNMRQQLALHDALNERSNLDVDELFEATNALNKLWTVYFPTLLDDLSLSSRFSNGCVASAKGLMEIIHLHKMNSTEIIKNITIPGPKTLPLLDAAGKLGSGLLSGNMILDGAYDECFKFDYTGYCVAEHVWFSDEIVKSPIFKYLNFTVGLCVPKHCGPSDIFELISYIHVLQSNKTNDSTPVWQTNYTNESVILLRTDESMIFCTDTKSPRYNVGAIIMMCVCGLFILLVAIGTIIDAIIANLQKQNDHHPGKVLASSPSINDSHVKSEKSPLLTQSTVERATSKKKFMPLDLITAFSLFKTVPTLLATEQAPTVITSLNGIRVISMFWVILGHTYFWIFTGNSIRVDNIFSLKDVASRFGFQAIVSAFFSVDSFFFLSGVLVAYLSLRQMKKRKGSFPIIHYYVHRYLRLTPAYAFVLFFAWFLTDHLSYGPVISLINTFSKACSKSWWANFLYINNIYPWKLTDECIGWSWYLANDMQFYCISPLILIPAYFYLPISLIIGSVFLFSGFIVTATLTGVYDFQENVFAAIAYNYTTNSSQTYDDAVYIKPWNRIAPYLVGLFLGYVFFKGYCFRFGRKLNFLMYLLLWVIASVILFTLVYSIYFTWHGHIPSKFENIVYITFSRFFWAVALGMIVFACHNGYGWFINSFLSMKIWTPLSRMTFNAYLLHPVVLTVVYGQLQRAVHYTDITFACYAVTFVVLSFGAATIVCLVVEFPLGAIEMLLVGSVSRDSQRQDVNLSLKVKDRKKETA